MFENFIKHTLKENNIIRRNLKLSHVKKLANAYDDLSKIPELKRFFRTKEEAETNLKNQKENKTIYDFRDYEWYVPTGNIIEFYVYQNPPIGVDFPMYFRCVLVELTRSGHNDYVTIAAGYRVNDNGNESNNLFGYQWEIDKDIDDMNMQILDKGVIFNGIHCLCGDEQYTDFDDLKKYVKKQIDIRNKNVVL